MIKNILYKYLGVNGTITSPVFLEDIYSIKVIQLFASEGKILTNGIEKKDNIIVSEKEAENWYEIDVITGQK